MFKKVAIVVMMLVGGCDWDVNKGCTETECVPPPPPPGPPPIVGWPVFMPPGVTPPTDTPDMGTPEQPDMSPVDPCAGVTCDVGSVCSAGVCSPLPDMTPADPCSGVTCDVGSACSAGTCVPLPDMSPVDPCSGVVCATGSVCQAGVCVPVDLCQGVTCPATYTCYDGQCIAPPPPECDYNQNCTWSYGYWKQHWVCNWQSLTLGTTKYSHDQLLAILNQPVNGNGLVDLAHQLIGAKMNIVKGADATSIQSTLNAADALIGGLVVPPIGTDSLTVASETVLSHTLEDFNLGNTGPGHCN